MSKEKAVWSAVGIIAVAVVASALYFLFTLPPVTHTGF